MKTSVRFDDNPTIYFIPRSSPEELVGTPGKDGYMFEALRRREFLPLYTYFCNSGHHIPNPNLTEEEDIDHELSKWIKYTNIGYIQMKRFQKIFGN